MTGDKKLTDSEIVKALECCSRTDGYGCEDCPYGAEDKCSINSKRDAIDLINRLQKELAKPILATRDLKVSFERIYRIGEEKALVQALKAEAYKEFAEKLEAEYTDFDAENEVILPENLNKAISDLLKELVGEDNESKTKSK